MSTKTTTKNQGTKAVEIKNSKIATANKTIKAVGVDNQENAESNTDLKPNANHAVNGEAAVSNTKESNTGETKKTPTIKSKSKKETQKKGAIPVKSIATGVKKIRLAATCYHYYRHFLKEFLRSVPSASFKKSPENYDGHIMILETEKTKGLRALEKWTKENPDVKELFWDVKK